MADPILDKLKTLKKGVVPKKKEKVEDPRLEEWKPIEEIINKVREKFLADKELGLGDMIDEIADGLAEIVKPTEEEENKAIVEGIAETKSKKLATIDQIKEE